eukprot:613066-Hanusia_phi.AAC.1
MMIGMPVTYFCQCVIHVTYLFSVAQKKRVGRPGPSRRRGRGTGVPGNLAGSDSVTVTWQSRSEIAAVLRQFDSACSHSPETSQSHGPIESPNLIT